MPIKTGTKEYRKVSQYIKIVKDGIWTDLHDKPELSICPCGYKKGNTPPALSEFAPFDQGALFGTGIDSHAWFHCTHGPVEENVFLRAHSDKTGWDASNPQFILYVNGKAVQGLDTNHREAPLPAGVPLDIYIYAYTGAKISESRFFCSLVRLNRDSERLYYDLLYPYQTLSYLNPESDEYALNLTMMYKTVSLLDLYDTSSDAYRESVSAAADYMEREYYEKLCSEKLPSVTCIGHTHIDCAWQWTLQQTREKVQRTFSTVLTLMKEYPEYRFMSSQPLLYQDLKEENPDLYAEVKQRVAEGRWEPEGSMWVEADCNLSSGESLIRQIMHGKEFFRNEFGRDNRVLWLPDVFGYAAAMPQILRKCGVDWFVTSKISWNDRDRMPYDTFVWKGIDGTGINSFFLTAQNDNGGSSVNGTTYVAKTEAPMVSGAYKRYQQKNLSREAMLTYGFGDGGGGPTREHLELLSRAMTGVPGSPTAKSEFAGDFLRRLEERIEGNPDLPVWNGELYLEFHRGTYTSQARNKKNNRKSEFLFQKAEMESVAANRLTGLRYPYKELHGGWEMILTNQFHDIIPGSSIREVYEQCEKDYAEIRGTGEKASADALSALAGKLPASGGTVVFNQTSFGGTLPVKIGGKTVFAEGIPENGYALKSEFITDNRVKIEEKNGKIFVETDIYKVVFNGEMNVVSLFDKREKRELIPERKCGNLLEIYADRPDSYDNWEWQEYSRAAGSRPVGGLEKTELCEDGVRRGIRIYRRYEHSSIVQTVWFYDSLERIDFDTELDWHEHHQMLKAAFPVDINSDKATYEIQFGSTTRPTHFNTSWDAARFEVCAQKYADLSDGGYGVGIINDCKYGHDIHEGVIRLSLLKCGTSPDEQADQGAMSFTYALCPHRGTLAASSVVRDAYILNCPCDAAAASGREAGIPAEFSAVSTGRDNLVCETVKQAEDGDGTVVRIYEALNMRTPVSIRTSLCPKHVYLCDMLENREKELPVKDGSFDYVFGGYEIATFRFTY